MKVTFKSADGAVLGHQEIAESQTVNEVANDVPPRLGESLVDAMGNRRSFSIIARGRKLDGDLSLIRHLQDDNSVVLQSDSMGAGPKP
jgi:hypothetical protein